MEQNAGGGRHERGPSRRGLVIGATGALVVVGAAGAVGAGALISGHDLGLGGLLGGSGGGSSDGGGEGDPSSPPPPDPAGDLRALVAELPDQAAHVPEAGTLDLNTVLQRDIVVPLAPGARGLNEAVDICVNKLLREALYAGDPAALSVAGRFVAAGPGILGVLLDVTDAAGASTALVWYRAEGDRALASPALIDSAQWNALTQLVAQAGAEAGLDADPLAEQLQQQPRPWGNGPSLLPAADGSLHVLLPAASVGGARQEALLTIPAASVEPLWSDVGLAVAQVVASPAAFDPAAVAVPGGEEVKGSTFWELPDVVTEAQPARESDGAGPVTQLAPLSGPGVRPSTAVAPDAGRLDAVALTFDDGPAPGLNETLREALLSAKHTATFFMIGQSVAEWPDLVTKTSADGYEVGSHSWSHPQLTRLGAEKLAGQLSRPAEKIAEATGRKPFVMRPPYGARNTETDRACGVEGESVHIWDVDTLDWQTKDRRKNVDAVISGTRRGSIILMHEIHQASIDAVPEILDWFTERGITTLTCAELGQNQMFAGKHYMAGLVDAETEERTPAVEPEPSDGGGEAGGEGTGDEGDGEG